MNYNIPKTWQIKKLGEILLRNDAGFWGTQDRGDNGAVLVLRSTNFQNDGFLNYDEVAKRNIPQDKLEKLELINGDILLEKSGGGPNQPVGRVAYFEAPARQKYAFANFIQRLRPDTALVDSKFLFYYLFRLYQVGLTQKLQSQTTGIRNLQLNRYLKYKIPLPSLHIQKFIVDRLDAVRKAQELDDKQIALAEELFQSLLHRELDPKGKNWKIKRITECLDFSQYGISLKMNIQRVGYPILRINNLLDGEIDTSDIKYVDIDEEEYTRYKLEKGDVLFNRVNSYDLVGKTSLFNLGNNYVFASYLIRLRTDSNMLLPEFLNYFLNSVPGQKAVKAKARRAVSQANVNARELGSIKLPLPPLPIQRRIVEKLQAVQDYKKSLLAQKAKIKELFESALDKAMKSEL